MEGEEDPKKASKKSKKKNDPKGPQEENSETETVSHESAAHVKTESPFSPADNAMDSTLRPPDDNLDLQNGKPKKSRSGNSTPKSPFKTSKSPSKKSSDKDNAGSKESTLKGKKSSALIKSINAAAENEVPDSEVKTPSVDFKPYTQESRIVHAEQKNSILDQEAKSFSIENRIPSSEIKSLGEVKALDPEPRYQAPDTATYVVPEVYSSGQEPQHMSPDAKSAGAENKSLTNEAKVSGTEAVTSSLDNKVLSGESGFVGKTKSSGGESAIVGKAKSSGGESAIVGKAKSSGGESGAVSGAKSSGGESGVVSGTKSYGGESGGVTGAKSFVKDSGVSITGAKSYGAESGGIGGAKSYGGETGGMMSGSTVPLAQVEGESDYIPSDKLQSANISEVGSGFLEKAGEKSTTSHAPKGRTVKGMEPFMPVEKGPSAFDTTSPQKTGTFACAAGLLQKRSPFIHNPPQPEERRARIQRPRTTREYIINLREDLADFQESHGLPRTRDYSFLSLGLALAQETGRAIYSVFLMFTELFPILAIVSLILRFALDKLIEILETPETIPKVKKSIIFALEMLAIMIPLWILVGTIIIPLLSLLLSIFSKMLRIRGGKRKHAKSHSKTKAPVETCSAL